MTDAELNKYRLTSLEEPSDEALEQIMRLAAEKARERNEAAQKSLREEVKMMIEEQERLNDIK